MHRGSAWLEVNKWRKIEVLVSRKTASLPNMGRKRRDSPLLLRSSPSRTSASFLCYRTDSLAECYGKLQHGGVNYCLVRAILVHGRGGYSLDANPPCWKPRRSSTSNAINTCRGRAPGISTGSSSI